MNTSFQAIKGNETVKQALQSALAARFPQAVLICGDDAAALEALSGAVAAALLCTGQNPHPCGRCPSCRKIAEDVHPDLTVIDEGENELKIEVARRLKAQTMLAPNEGDRSVVLLRHAQQMNVPTQNALLKLLEEPPPHAFFVLTSEAPEALLETVRSRCLRFALEPVDALDEAASAALLAPYLEALARGDETAMMQAAVALEKTPRRAMLSLIGVLQTALRDAIFVYHALPEAPLLPTLSAQTAALARAVSGEALLTLYHFCHTLRDRLSRNAGAAAVTLALTAEAYSICYL